MPVTRAARKLAGSSGRFDKNEHVDTPAHYLAIHKAFPYVVDSDDFPSVHRRQREPNTYADRQIICFTTGGGIDFSTGIIIEQEEVEAAYIETPPWRAIRRFDDTRHEAIVYQNAPVLAETITTAILNDEGVFYEAIVPLPGGDGGDVAFEFWKRFPGLIDTIAWLLSGIRKEIPVFTCETAGVGKTTRCRYAALGA